MPKLTEHRYLVLHSYGPPPPGSDHKSMNGLGYDIRDVDQWHKARGFRRENSSGLALKHVGYHKVITATGISQRGRNDDERGAHCRGYNWCSIGICMAGTDRFSAAQWAMLRSEICGYLELYPGILVVGHHQLDDRKDWPCPGFSVPEYMRRGMVPMADWILSQPID